MAARRPQTQAKRARELAVKERRERKLAKKLARAAERRGEDESSALETAPDGEAHPSTLDSDPNDPVG